MMMACLIGVDVDVELQLNEGETILGRGPLLKIVDKRVSRKHAVIELKDGSLTLCPKHSNPCFVRSSGRSEFRPIMKDEEISLSDGDQLSLLPDSLRYRIEIERRLRTSEDVPLTAENERSSVTERVREKVSIGRKRVLPSWLSSLSTDTTSIEPTGHTARKRKIPPPTSPPLPLPSPSPLLPSPSPTSSPPLPSPPPTTTPSITVAETGNEQSLPLCPYGTACYRKNPAHFQEYSHNFTEDNRPECPYGTTCYRKNPDHRRQFSHSGPHTNQPKPKRTKQDQTRPKRTKKRVSVLAGDSDESDAPNTYDYNDSFIDDEDLSSGSTSYGGESEDSDWAPSATATASGEGREEEEDVGGLVDEAEDFISNNKMWQK